MGLKKNTLAILFDVMKAKDDCTNQEKKTVYSYAVLWTVFLSYL